MSPLKTKCRLCEKAFETTEVIHCINGEAYHFRCIKEAGYPTSSSSDYYFHFHDIFNCQTFVDKLKKELDVCKNEKKEIAEENGKKLKDCNDEIRKLKEELNRRINDFQKLNDISNQQRTDLEDKIIKMTVDNKESIKNYAKEMELKICEINFLKTKNLEQTKANEHLLEQINRLEKENAELKKKISEKETANIIFNQKIDRQEERVKYLELRVQKYFAYNSEKILVPVPTTNTSTSKKSAEVAEDVNKSKLEFQMQEKRISIATAAKPEEHKKSAGTESLQQTKKASIESNEPQLPDSHNFNVIILDFPREKLLFPIKTTVVLLSKYICTPIELEDIKDVHLINPNKNSVIKNKVTLHVEFKNYDTKVKFLTHKKNLRSHSVFKSTQIREYVDQAIYTIYQQANRLLRPNGYEYVYTKDNKVYAKKKRADIEEIEIKTIKDIDLLLVNDIKQRNN